ncbi:MULTISPECIES: SF0329 family protein [Roseobacteraceae]|nr:MULTISPECIES: hypothetical protein [Roseobacteraceae]
MRWTKLKQRIEDCFAESAKGRVEVWNTRYRNSHDQEGEAWITIDKIQVHSMGSLTYLVKYYEQSTQIQQERACQDYGDDQQIKGYLAAQEEVQQRLRNDGTIPLEEFNSTLFEYLNLSIEEILGSDQMVLRALGMFDKRLGKRRLKSLNLSSDHELVQSFFRIRCAFEGIRPQLDT